MNNRTQQRFDRSIAVASAKHTPGPWRAEPVPHGGYRIESANPHVSATIADSYGRYGSAQGNADSCLIASAPDLLAALLRCRALLSPAFCAGDPSAEEMRSIVRAAIAKAEGR